MCPVSRHSHGNETDASLVQLLIEPNWHDGRRPRRPFRVLAPAVVLGALGAFASSAYAWDHPGHMTTAAIEYEEIET